MKGKLELILSEIHALARVIKADDFEALIGMLQGDGRVFAAGAGRTGEIMRCLTKRLMHAGVDAHVLGETVTPPAVKDDLLIIGSGSGETESLIILARKARNLGVKVALITTNTGSTIAKEADVVLHIPATTPKAKAPSQGAVTSAQPMANLFEQMLYLCCDAMCMKLAECKGLSSDEMFTRHANLE